MLNKLKQLRKTTNDEGFTLIELMIVIIIILILIVIAIPIFEKQEEEAIIAGLKSDVKNTNTNIVTTLANLPLATSIGGSVSYNTSPNNNYEACNAPCGYIYTSSVSGSYDLVRTRTTTYMQVGGKWDNYYIVAMNNELDDDTSQYEWNWTTNTPEPRGKSLIVYYSAATGKIGVVDKR